MSKEDKYIKTKVFFSYALIIILITSLLYFTFTSFRQLTRSADVLAQPNARIALLHDIMFSIYQAESNIRAYTLNEKESFLNDYFEDLSAVNDKVDSLYALSRDDLFFNEIIDSINLQLISKTQLLEQFIQMKRMDENSEFYERALTEILKVTEEEKRIREVTHQSIVDTLPADTLTYTAEEITQEKDNLFTRIRKFFSGDRDEENNADTLRAENEPLPQTSPQILTDSIITIYRDTDDLRADIENTMASIMDAMTERQRYIQQLETRILTEDKQVMDQIREFVVRLEDYESANALEEAAAAHANVQETTDKIFLVVILSLMVLLVFSWLFVTGVNRSRYYRRQLIAEKARAEELVEIKQRFMANISHEIRTPLSSIIGFSRQLKKALISSKKEEEFVDAINQSSRHLLGIVNDILDFSKIEAGKIRLESIPVDIKTIINEVYDTLVILAREKNLVFLKDMGELKQPLVLGDPLRLRQIILNIASNAIKFTPSGSVIIKVSDYQPDNDTTKNHIKIKITDTGIGISEEEKEKIFEEFAQSDARVNRQFGGTGLGLSISRKLTEMMGGAIEIESKTGKGSEFTIHLPLEICTEEVLATEISFESDHEELKGRIMLVDDDKLNRLLIRSLLEMLPQISLYEAESAADALEMLWNENYDLIITDIQMPGMSGIEMVQRLRNQKENPNCFTPVLACTADITQETIDSIKAAGIEDIITKPIDEKLLLDKMSSIMNSFLYQDEWKDTQEQDFYRVESNSGFLNKTRAGEPSVLQDEKTNDQVFYDLEGIKSFTGNDDASMASILKAFIEETRQNIGKLERAGVSKDAQEVQSIIHKMSNMMGLLNAHAISLCIRKIKGSEVLDLNDTHTIENLQNLIRLSHQLVEELKKESLLQQDAHL